MTNTDQQRTSRKCPAKPPCIGSNPIAASSSSDWPGWS